MISGLEIVQLSPKLGILYGGANESCFKKVTLSFLFFGTFVAIFDTQGAEKSPLICSEALAWSGPLAAIERVRTETKAGISYTFPSLNQSQFNLLVTEFGGLSEVNFVAGEVYTLVDFLPPMMQALLGRELNEGKEQHTIIIEPRLMTQDPIYTTSNCYTTTYNWFRNLANTGLKSFQLFWLGRHQIDQVLTDPEVFQSVSRNMLKFVDSVLFYSAAGEARVLMHTGVYLGHGLVFEKPDTGKAMWRIQSMGEIENTMTYHAPKFLSLDEVKLKLEY